MQDRQPLVVVAEPTLPVVAYSKRDAARASGLSEQSISKAMREGLIEARWYGRKPLITAASLIAFLESLPTERQGGLDDDSE